ncbi:hypothetical protein [Parafrankia sp. EUN1f]|uniref:hypothetical protein n=1 Tax=Parafrankia sp. EUN1f TaxID=102897 RepID=UPI0001C45244|nr:hypothetical protein [Parafrankia sp. EUN1f]EFC79169.1 hypothetical protein FrEUN1fDRAFT_7700 [Parafrankia sp. EUN1f]
MIPEWLALLNAAVGAFGSGLALAYALLRAGDAAVRSVRAARPVPATPADEGTADTEPLSVLLPPPLAGEA